MCGIEIIIIHARISSAFLQIDILSKPHMTQMIHDAKHVYRRTLYTHKGMYTYCGIFGGMGVTPSDINNTSSIRRSLSHL